MESELLQLSTELIRVKYVFKNESKTDIKTVVAFPMPEIQTESPISIRLFEKGEKLKENPLNFQVKVDGKVIPAKLEAKRTPDTIVLKYYWTQVFPAGKLITIEHSYTPAIGTGWDPEMAKDYCFDASFEKSLNALTSKLSKRLMSDDKSLVGYNRYLEYLHFNDKRLHYVLKTGANWKGPIKKFRLEIEKRNPNLIMSLCWKGKIKKEGNVYVAEENEFVPTEDLAILFVNTAIKPSDGIKAP